MRKALLALTILVIVAASIAFIVWRLTRKPAPTPIGWRAHVTTVAGDGSPPVLSDPFGIAVAKDGTIFFTDAGEHNTIRKISPQGAVTVFSNGFNTPSGLTIDANDNLFLAETSNNRIIKVNPNGTVSTIAGDGTAGYVDGPATQAR